ncbi:MAG: zinc ribbon domain-containing protein [Pseudomonadota bacterium]
MDLIKGVRAPERGYRAVLWLVSIVFAGFIIGLGNLIIGDLPMVDNQVVAEPLARSAEQLRIDGQVRAIDARMGRIDDRLEVARLQLEQAQRASNTGRDTFRAWIETRTATTDPAQDSELIARTRQLEQLKANERTLQETVATLENERLPLDQQRAALRERDSRIEADAVPARQQALFWHELRVFGLRLLITLPMLAAAVWLVVKKRRSDHWPLARGFVLAAAFVFFVELVPYLPSYGGYVRYAVGIVLTFAAGHFLVKNMRAYLARRQEGEAQAAEERRRHVNHDEAYRKMAAKICPGCDRPSATTGDAESNFCVHCGLTLFDHCRQCDTRKMAFFRYCMTCGAPAEASPAPSAAPVPA